MTRRIPLPLADEVNVLFGLPAATVAVVLTGALAAGFAFLHGGAHGWIDAGVVALLTLTANVPWEEEPLYVWIGRFCRFAMTPRIYVCPTSCPDYDSHSDSHSMEDEVSSYAHGHAKALSHPGHRR